MAISGPAILGWDMGQYRLYCVGEGGGFNAVHEIEAETDAEALAAAREMRLSLKCELWERGRKVADVPAAKR
jgi:hypothetical protein